MNAPTLSRTAGQVAATLDALQAELNAAGLLAAQNMRDLPGPGLLILAPTLHMRFGGCTRIDLTMQAVAQSAGRPAGIAVLVDLIDRAGAVLGYPWESAVAIDLPLVSGQVAPAYQVTWSVPI